MSNSILFTLALTRFFENTVDWATGPYSLRDTGPHTQLRVSPRLWLADVWPAVGSPDQCLSNCMGQAPSGHVCCLLTRNIYGHGHPMTDAVISVKQQRYFCSIWHARPRYPFTSLVGFIRSERHFDCSCKWVTVSFGKSLEIHWMKLSSDILYCSRKSSTYIAIVPI